jgi:prepilin-type N-terminal cleavage/methylation domain-containing protein/prepilin-type processing-associated H-X9-DG protein
MFGTAIPQRQRQFTLITSAFTLIELLVVIAIIAILAAILFPVFAQARAKARQAACLSNMKQISTGLMMYTQDYDEVLPGNDSTIYTPGSPHGEYADAGIASRTTIGFLDTDPTKVLRNWGRDIQPYIKNTQVYMCPDSVPRNSLSATPSATYAETNDPRGANASYLLNGVTATKALAAIPAPADIIYIQEYKAKSRVSQVRPRQVPNVTPPTFDQLNHMWFDVQHNGGGNLLFCDGHAKFRKKSGIMYKEFGLNTSGQTDPNRKMLDTDAGATSENGIRMPAAF